MRATGMAVETLTATKDGLARFLPTGVAAIAPAASRSLFVRRTISLDSFCAVHIFGVMNTGFGAPTAYPAPTLNPSGEVR